MDARPTDVLFQVFHTECVKLIANSVTTDTRDLAYSKLEYMGYKVGLSLAQKLSLNRPSTMNQLECIKLICRDVWQTCFNKPIDNLRTNHKGTYVLQDNDLSLFIPLATGRQYIEEAASLLALPCGIIRGVLFALRYNAVVRAELSELPACSFELTLDESA
eukprot:Clim_evm55s225 gene=Clim_evmTU55s225